MLHTASQLQIPELMQHCRGFLWTNLYPSNAWRGYQGAQTANDEVLKEAALQVLSNTSLNKHLMLKFNGLKKKIKHI
jgi:hypothetical protein